MPTVKKSLRRVNRGIISCCVALRYLGQDDEFLETYWSRGESTHWEMFCRDIHEHGVNLHTRSVNVRANEDATNIIAHGHCSGLLHKP